jgi:hypothetical protein
MVPAPQLAFNESLLRQIGLSECDGRIVGRGIAIGFADWGFDLAHPCLMDASGRHSRFLSVWDQNRGDGSDLRRKEIDVRLAVAAVAQSRDGIDAALDPHANYCWPQIPEEGAHGTLMASIAAGTPYAGFRGVAIGAELIGVQLAMQDSHWKEVDASGQPTWRDWCPTSQTNWDGWRSYDEQPQLVAALDYLYARAKASGVGGLVINLSLGASAGAHDGASPVEQRITDLVAQGTVRGELPTVVVVAAGNAGVDEGHFSAEVLPGRMAELIWRMCIADPTPNKLEIWYRGKGALRVELLLGGAHCLSSALAQFAIAPGPTVPLIIGGRLAGIGDHKLGVRNGLSCVRVILHPPYFPDAMPRDAFGDVSFRLQFTAPSDEAEAVHVNAWLERDDGLKERSSLSPCHPMGTLGSIALAKGAIAVAGFDHRESSTGSALFALSALGPAPWPHLAGQRNPHIAAPGLGIWGAKSKTRGFARTSGTSPAAAIASGAVALMMQHMTMSSRPIRAHDIRERLAEFARPLEPKCGEAWSARYGWGAINVDRLFGEASA